MNLREALIAQAPSLELQRAAQAEIARLDHEVHQQSVRASLLYRCISNVMTEEQLDGQIRALNNQSTREILRAWFPNAPEIPR